MPDWLRLQEPIVLKVAVGAAAIVLLVILGRLWRRWRESAAAARRRRELQRTYGQVQEQQRATAELAAQIVATGSTAVIAGFQVVRQIEAVFAEAPHSPAVAVELLKALAARKGANAIINLNGQRLPGGKCVASGDAVIVRPLDGFAPDVRSAELKRGNGERGLDRRWD